MLTKKNLINNNVQGKKRSKMTDKTFNTIFVYIGLILAALFVILPFLIIFVTSFKTVGDASSLEFTLIGEKDGISFQGYLAAFEYKDFSTDTPILLIGFANTMLTSVLPTIASLFFSALAAFAFAKIKFKFSKLFFDILIFTMMIPGTILIIPHYMMYEEFGWIDTYAPLIIPALWGGASMIFFIRQFMYSIPNSLIESAKIDGLSWLGIFMRIILPLIVPALLAQGLLAFISRYNAYLGPYLYLQSENMFTLQLAVAGFKSAYAYNYPAIMSVSLITIVPILIIYVIFQKYFVEGIATTGMKL